MTQVSRSFVLPAALLALAALGASRMASGKPGSALAASVASRASWAGGEAPARAPRDAAGDAYLRGAVDLGAMERSGDHYEVALAHGRRAILTLDPTLQAAAEAALAAAKAPDGAIVVLAVDGRVLALAGSGGGKAAKPSGYDRALSTWAPAASVFKLVTTAALLEAGLEPETTACYHGGVHSIERSNLDDDRRDDRCHDLAYAVAESQNAIIAKLAHHHLSPAALADTAGTLGFGHAPSFALAAEADRLDVPEEPLAFARVAAGFWSSEMSPLGGALLADTIATGGLRVVPQIVAAVIERDGSRTEIAPAASERVMDGAIASKLGAMMVATTERGTAYKGFHDGRGRPYLHSKVAGKTGSLTQDKPYRAFSWFVGFAPADQPEVAIAVALGNPENWFLKAHTAARMVLAAREP